MANKIVYLEGLRGIAAIAVFIGHMVNAFYPVAQFASGSVLHHPLEIWFAGSPISVLWNGNTAVCLFFVISGFVLSHKYFQTYDSAILISGASRRYFRLAIPSVVSILIACLFLQFQLFYNQEAGILTGSKWLEGFYNFAPNWGYALWQGVYLVFFKGNASYNINLWTMKIEFLGSFLVFGYCALFAKLRWRWSLYALLIWVFWGTYYLGFIAGMILSDIYAKNQRFIQSTQEEGKITLLALICLSIGLFFGGYRELPVGFSDSVYYALNVEWINFHKLDLGVFYHLNGSILIMISVLLWKRAQKILSNRFFAYLGRISFSLYLVHLIVICSVSSKMIVAFQSFSYHLAAFATMGISVLLTVLISHYYYKWVDLPAVDISKELYRKSIGKMKVQKCLVKDSVNL